MRKNFRTHSELFPPKNICLEDSGRSKGQKKVSSGHDTSRLSSMGCIQFAASADYKPTSLGNLILKEQNESCGTFFKNFPQMTRENDNNCGDWNNSEIRAYFYNGAYYYKIGSQVVKLDDKMNFVKVVDKIDAPDYNVQTSTLNRLRMCRENLLKTWSCSGYYSLDELDELLPEIDEKLEEKNKIKEDIENLEKDKNKKRELEEYKRQLGIKRGQELFWSLFKNKAKREDIENFMCHDSKELIKLMKQIKKSGFMSDYNFLSKEQAIDLGKIIAVPLSIGGYGWNKDGQSWIDIHDRRDYLSEVINRNIFSKKALRKFFDEFELKYLRNGVDQEVADFIDCVMSDPYVLKHR